MAMIQGFSSPSIDGRLHTLLVRAPPDSDSPLRAEFKQMGWTAPTALTCHDAGRESRGKGAIHNER
jgi:hypothetical protein